jgi:hypothetical protein
MPSYHIDENWNLVKNPLTAKDISDLANAYQQKYFPGQSPKITINVNPNEKFQGMACFDPSKMTIHIAQRITEFDNTTKVALLHEMIHANLHARGFDADPGHEHGPEFRAEVKRLMAAGAYDALL